jgi:hypothetical protein
MVFNMILKKGDLNVSLYRTKRMENWTHNDYWCPAGWEHNNPLKLTLVDNYLNSDKLSDLLFKEIITKRSSDLNEYQSYSELYEYHVLFKEDIEKVIKVLNERDPESVYVSKFKLLLYLTDWGTNVLMYLSM